MFSEEADFNGATFKGFVDFYLARFNKFTQFSAGKNERVFNGEARFVDIKIKYKLRLTGANLKEALFM